MSPKLSIGKSFQEMEIRENAMKLGPRPSGECSNYFPAMKKYPACRFAGRVSNDELLMAFIPV